MEPDRYSPLRLIGAAVLLVATRTPNLLILGEFPSLRERGKGRAAGKKRKQGRASPLRGTSGQATGEQKQIKVIASPGSYLALPSPGANRSK
jgi:hypothetical protein